MSRDSFGVLDAFNALRTMAGIAIENEKYFCELDGQVGDADFGRSLASGFRAVLAQLDSIDAHDFGSLLIRAGTIFSSAVGGTSGPVWGTAFLRAGLAAKGKSLLTITDLVEMGNNAIQGIMARGGAQRGDKTLLDALFPAVESLSRSFESGKHDVREAFACASAAAFIAAEETRPWLARRGRQSYAQERSAGTLDPGIVAVGLMAKAVADRMTAVGACAEPKRESSGPIKPSHSNCADGREA